MFSDIPEQNKQTEGLLLLSPGLLGSCHGVVTLPDSEHLPGIAHLQRGEHGRDTGVKRQKQLQPMSIPQHSKGKGEL